MHSFWRDAHIVEAQEDFGSPCISDFSPIELFLRSNDAVQKVSTRTGNVLFETCIDVIGVALSQLLAGRASAQDEGASSRPAAQ